MVVPKYERLNSGDVDGECDVGSDGNGEGSFEELELNLEQTKKHTGASLERRQLQSNANFKFAKTNSGVGSNGDSGSGATLTQHQLPSSSMTRHLDARFMQMAFSTVIVLLVYLLLSITLTFYQTDINRELPYPLTIVTYHLIIKFMLAAMIRSIYKMRVGKTRVQLDWRVAVRKMAPTGIASGIDIGFSNWGLALVPISLYTMTKSSTIVFILLFAIMLGLERKSWSLVLIVGLIGLGLFMFTYKSTQFNTLGFIFILFASLSSGLRWSFAQFIMQKTKLGLHNPIDMIYHMQPWMIASLLPLIFIIEGPKLAPVLENLPNITEEVIIWTMLKVTLGALIAFCMEVTEFLVLCKTSSLTLSIAGIFKDICQLALAVAFKGDQLSPINLVGLAVCLAGICCHLLHKYNTMSQLSRQQSTLEEDDENMSAEYDFNKDTTILGVHVNTVGSHATLTVPLLEQTDSEEESANDNNKQNASDVIFDVLKRRDMQR